ncbi:mercuric transport protein MerTP [Pedobacter nutrimenti]|uniref:Mercuric transport protein MerT n=1 Tax=Pedobacter nutrimenti TaxID=1241337 RepID=A0A318UQS5_9SPHI|nr:mercuric transport protein MerTP [Pedobacter nutrimenti]PYF77428.1 copper chaperone CopZ [Pedobacter nutrimenti]
MSKTNHIKLLSSGILLALTSSLCCIVPVLALFGSIGSAASMFGWVEPIRPYLLGATAAVLAMAFYKAYQPRSTDQCGCEEKKTVMQSKTFLWVIALVSLALSAFPYYISYFQKPPAKQSTLGNTYNKQSVLHIRGLSCAACEGYINHALQSKKGVQSVVTSYGKGQSVVKFDSTLVSLAQLEEAVEKETGYKITNKSSHVN